MVKTMSLCIQITILFWGNVTPKTESIWLTENVNFLDSNSSYVLLHNLKNIIEDIASTVDYIYVKEKKAKYIRSLTSSPVVEFNHQRWKNENLKVFIIKRRVYVCVITFIW